VTAPLVVPGSADPASTPATLRAIPHRGGALNPTADRIKSQFAEAFVRAEVIWGETNVYLRPESVLDVVRYLHDDAQERYDYLSDVTAVEYRDLE
jgi:NADH-quinone oxidoreductase subunit C